MLRNRETGELEPAACRNLDEEEWKTVVATTLKGGLARMLPENNAPLIVLNGQTAPRSLAPEFLRKHGLVSYLRVPMTAKGEALGVLTFFAKEEHYFTQEEVEFLTTLAGQAAIAINNSKLYEQTREQMVELEKSNKVKEFLSVMSHELRTPLTVVTGYVGMIMDGMLGEVNDKQKDALEKVLRRTDEQLAMVNNILHATVLETEKIRVESHAVVLGDFLKQLSSAYEIPLNKQITFNWDCSAPLTVIHTDSGKLKQILQNLIDNAIKFTAKGSVTISAGITEGRNQ